MTITCEQVLDCEASAAPEKMGKSDKYSTETLKSKTPIEESEARVSAEPISINRPVSPAAKPIAAQPKDKLMIFLSSLKLEMILVGMVSIVFGIALWHFATLYNLNYFINFENIPAPLDVGKAFLRHAADTEFHTHILVSLRRIAIAYSLAVVLGIFVGLLVGRSRLARAAVLPYIEIIRPIPAVAWIPLAILMWPTEESSIVYITFLGALFPIILNTVHGVEQTPEVLVRAALSLGAARLKVFWHVVLPAALPSIGAGLAIGMGVSWFSLLAGEIISGQYGIGYFTWNAYSLINYPDIIVGMLIIGGLGSLSTYLVRVVMAPALRWKKSTR